MLGTLVTARIAIAASEVGAPCDRVMPIVQPLLSAPAQGIRKAAEGVHRVFLRAVSVILPANYDWSGRSASRNEATQAKGRLHHMIISVLNRLPEAQLLDLLTVRL